MRLSTLFLTTALAAMAAAPLGAQTPASGANRAGDLGGNPVPGLCMLSREAVLANAKVGKAAVDRLKQISDQAQAEVDAQQKPVQDEIKAFQAVAPTLPADQRATRERALQAKLEPLQALANQRSREIDATRIKALQQVNDQARPIIAAQYKQHNCGLMIDRNMVIGGNYTNDLTPAVVQALDAKVSTITFERENLPAQGQAQPQR